MQIHANCRIRRVYFSDRLYSEEELPAEFKLYLPVQQKQHAGMNLIHFFFLKDLFLYLAIDSEFHPSRIFKMAWKLLQNFMFKDGVIT